MAGVTWIETSRNLATGQSRGVNFQQADRSYEVIRTYRVHGLGAEEVSGVEPGDLSYPSSVRLYHRGEDINGNAYDQTVRCYIAERPSVLTSPDVDGAIEVKVSYRGRVCGFHKMVGGQIDRSFTRVCDLRPSSDGSYPGIGVDLRGVEVMSPYLSLGLVVVVPTNRLQGCLTNIARVAAMANEANWYTPWEPDFTTSEGYWLCAGLSNITSDDVSKTSELIIRFDHDWLRPWGQHMWHERYAIDIPVGIALDRKFEDYIRIRQIYELAGAPYLTVPRTPPLINGTFAEYINGIFLFLLLGGDTPQILLSR